MWEGREMKGRGRGGKGRESDPPSSFIATLVNCVFNFNFCSSFRDKYKGSQT